MYRHSACRALSWLVALAAFGAFGERPVRAQSVACPTTVPAGSECAAWEYHPWKYLFAPSFGSISFHGELESALQAGTDWLIGGGCGVAFPTGASSYDCTIGGACSAWGWEPTLLRMQYEYTCADHTTQLRIIHDRTVTGPSPASYARCPEGYQQQGTAHSLYGDPPEPVGAELATYACWRPARPVTTQRHGANGCLSKGNPCDVLVGNKRQRELDYEASGLSFARTYNSLGFHAAKQGSRGTPLGEAWFGSYFQYLAAPSGLSSRTVHAVRPDGDVIEFTATSPGSTATEYRPQGELENRLVVALDAAGTFAGWRYVTANDDEELFDADGRLLSIEARGGVTQRLTYAANGRVAAVSDDFGRALAFGWDTSVPSRLVSLTLPGTGSERIEFGYGANNNLVQVRYADSRTRRYFYELTGAGQQNLLTSIEDESGVRYATWTYGAGNVVTSSVHAGGADSYRFTYGADGSRTVVDPLGTSRTYATAMVAGQRRYTGSNKHCQGCGEYASASFDALGNFERKVNFDGVETRFTHDTVRTLETSRTEAYGTALARTISTTWHPAYRLPTLLAEPGRTTSFEYDAAGNLLAKAMADTATGDVRRTTWTYDAYGRVLTEDGPRLDVSDVTTYAYYTCTTGYQCGQLQSVTNALSQTTVYGSYDAHGLPLRITDSNGAVTTLAYDARQRLASRTIDGEETRFEYWPAGLLGKVTLPDGSYLQYTYDGAHRLVRVEDAAGNYVAYTLDGMGNRTAEETRDSAGSLRRVRSRVFNGLNQVHQELTAAGAPQQATVFGYDANGNRATIDAPVERSSVHEYDDLDRLAAVTDPGGGVTRFAYDGNDNVIAVTDPRNTTTSYTYDGLDQLRMQQSPDTGLTTSTYDAAGNLTTSIDARNAVSAYRYDALNRVVAVEYSRKGIADQVVRFSYDTGAHGIGRLAGASDDRHSMAWTYDAQGRITAKTQAVGDFIAAVGYGYTNGNLTTIATPSGQTVAYRYDANAQVTSIAVNGVTLLSGVTYEPFGPVNGWVWGNGTTARRTFDDDGNIIEIASGGRIDTYLYDDALRIAGIIDPARPKDSYAFGYDALDRLTSAVSSSASQGWTYDASGNRLSETGQARSTYKINAIKNRLRSITGAIQREYTYNAAGSVRSYGDVTVTYNDHGRLKAFTRGSTTARFVYNAFDQRVKRSGGGTGTVHYVYDEAGRLLGEYNAAGRLIQETVWLGDIPVATLRSGTPVRIFYVHADHLNTPRLVTRPSDNKARWAWDRTPFGTALPNESPAGLAPFEYTLRFPGQVYDAHMQLMQNHFRDYDPVTGRYIESDPIGLAGGLNTYAYVGGDPVGAFDPNGLAQFGWRPLGAGTGRLDAAPRVRGNVALAHEHLWFDDDPNDNVGFFAGSGERSGWSVCGEEGDVRQDFGHTRAQYVFSGPVYDDARMRRALSNIRSEWEDRTYCLVGSNCQSFADALRSEYSRLGRVETRKPFPLFR